jgi:hypothetical protein
MKQLAPQDTSLWLRFLFFSCVPDNLQILLAKDKGTVEQLAARVDKYLRKAPRVVTEVPIPAAIQEEVVAAAAQDRYPPKRHKGNKAKRRRPHDGPNPTTKKQRSEPWV